MDGFFVNAPKSLFFQGYLRSNSFSQSVDGRIGMEIENFDFDNVSGDAVTLTRAKDDRFFSRAWLG